MRRYWKSSKGFSLMEVMIAAGLLGAISLGVMKIMDMQTKSSRQMNNTLTEGEIYRRITTNLADSKACLETLKSSLSDSPAIANKSGRPLYFIGQKIDHILIRDITFSDNEGDGQKTVIINVILERTGTMAGVKVVSKTFKVDAKFESGAPISCYLDKENLISTTMAEVKTSLENGSVGFEKINLQTADGKTSLKIENGKIILKGDIRIEDSDGRHMTLGEYITKEALESAAKAASGECEAENFSIPGSMTLATCEQEGGSSSCSPAISNRLDCSCSVMIPKGTEGETRSISCKSKNAGEDHTLCYVVDGVCGPRDKKGNLYTTQRECPSYSRVVACTKGKWVIQ